MNTSVLNKEGAFTEQRSSINFFFNATSNKDHNLKTTPRTEMKQRFSSSQGTQWCPRFVDWNIDSLTNKIILKFVCKIIVLNLRILAIVLNRGLPQKYYCVCRLYINGFLKFDHNYCYIWFHSYFHPISSFSTCALTLNLHC